MKAFEVVHGTAALPHKFAELWVPWLKAMTGKEPEAEDLHRRMGFVPMSPPSQMLVLARAEIVMGLPLNAPGGN